MLLLLLLLAVLSSEGMMLCSSSPVACREGIPQYAKTWGVNDDGNMFWRHSLVRQCYAQMPSWCETSTGRCFVFWGALR